MKKIKFLLALFVLAFIIIGCEETTTVEVEIPDEEYIVVESELVADSLFTGVRFTKTLPIGELYDINKAELKSVVAYLKVDDAQIIPVHYDSAGWYRPLYDYRIEPGRKYELIAEYNDILIYARTNVPQVPEVQRVIFSNEYYLSAEVKTKQHEVYGAAWVIGSRISSSFHSITEPVNQIVPQIVDTRTSLFDEDLRSAVYRSNSFIRVYAFDEQFFDYFRSKDNHQFIEDGISQGGGLVTWNTFGDNVIGVFMGIAHSPLIFPEGD